MTGPSDVTPVRGIVLDAELAAKVRGGSRCERQGRGFFHGTALGYACPGDILTHMGGSRVDELVAAHDEGRECAEALRFLADDAEDEGLPEAPHTARDIADFLDAQADALIDPALVAAWHAQHDTDGGAS